MECLLRRSSRLVITSNISSGTGSSWSLCRPVGMCYDAALSRTVRKIFSSLWQHVGRERLLRASSTSCLYLSQLAFFRLDFDESLDSCITATLTLFLSNTTPSSVCVLPMPLALNCRTLGDHGRSVLVAIPARQQDQVT